MRHTITYNDLFAIEEDIKSLPKNAPGIAFLVKGTINRFYERASMNLKAMNQGIIKLQKKYAEADEEGNLITDAEKGHIKFKDAVTGDDEKTLIGAEVEQAYLDEMNVFMSRSIVIDM